MTDDPRVQQLLDELLGSDTTPEVVCKSCPELLPVVRKRWRQMRRFRADLDDLFPPADELVAPSEGGELPIVPGYEVESVLGRGGMGIVYRARHVRLNRLVALKMLLAGVYATPREQARFQREAEAVAKLKHPNIVQIHDVADTDGRPYFTMEYVEKGSLARKLAGVPQPDRHAAELIATLAQAVQAAHERGIVHRDLKPSNILLAEDGTPKITDFGLARREDEGPALTQTGVAIGTPSYMAPEQARGRPDAVGPAVDVYALGAVLYELLTGRPPFCAATAAETVQQVLSQEPAPPSRLNNQVPRELETICLKCLSKEPPSRYGTAAELADDLLRYLRGEPILARRAGPAERLVKWTRRNRSLAASLVMGLLLLTVSLGVGGWMLIERTALRWAVNEDLDQVVLAQKAKKYDQARTALERAKGRLGDGGPAELRRRAERLERELALIQRIEEIILAQVNSPQEQAEQAAHFKAVFREIGFIEGQEDPAIVAARIRATGIAASMLAALDFCSDDWAERDPRPRTWLLDVARLLDDDPASRPMRDKKLWENKLALVEFAESAPLANQSVPFLIFLSRKLKGHGGNAIAFLKRVQHAHVNSDLATTALANSLIQRSESAESVPYFRAAIALRPTDAALRHNLSKALGALGRWEDALLELKEARRLVPDSAVFNTSIGRALNHMNQPTEAERELREVLETHPKYPPCLTGLADSLFQQGKHEQAFDTYRRAIAVDPNFGEAHQHLKERYITVRRWEDARQAWEQWLAFESTGIHIWEEGPEYWPASDPGNHQVWDGYAELCLYLGNKAEYERARTELLKRFGTTTDRQVAERTGRACLLQPAADDELLQATRLIDLAMASQREKPDGLLPYFRFAKALAEYRAGRLKGALTLLDGDTLRILGPAPRLLLAMVQRRLGQAGAAGDSLSAAEASYDWDPEKATNREAWMYHLLRREAETVLASTP